MNVMQLKICQRFRWACGFRYVILLARYLTYHEAKKEGFSMKQKKKEYVALFCCEFIKETTVWVTLVNTGLVKEVYTTINITLYMVTHIKGISDNIKLVTVASVHFWSVVDDVCLNTYISAVRWMGLIMYPGV